MQGASATTVTYIEDRIITLHVCGPQVPSIDLVDLPGIRQTGSGAGATKSIVSQHIKEHGKRSLFLFVMRAGEVKANYSALAIAEDHKAEVPSIVENSIGVLTMLDMLSSRAIAKTMKQVMTGEEKMFERYGWVATMNAPPEPETEDGETSDTGVAAQSGFRSLQKQAQREVDFFKAMNWPEEKRSQLTTNNMIGHLNVMFKDYLEETWMPGAIKKLLARLQQIDFERLKLGIVAGSPVSSERNEARQLLEKLNNDYADVTGAVSAITTAFSITPEHQQEMAKAVEWT